MSRGDRDRAGMAFKAKRWEGGWNFLMRKCHRLTNQTWGLQVLQRWWQLGRASAGILCVISSTWKKFRKSVVQHKNYTHLHALPNPPNEKIMPRRIFKRKLDLFSYNIDAINFTPCVVSFDKHIQSCNHHQDPVREYCCHP